MYNITQILKIERPINLLNEAVVRENFSLSKKTSVVISTDKPQTRLYYISISSNSDNKKYDSGVVGVVLEDFEINQDIDSNTKLAKKKELLTLLAAKTVGITIKNYLDFFENSPYKLDNCLIIKPHFKTCLFDKLWMKAQ